MSFEQTRDILVHVREYHARVSAYYHSLRDSASQQRVLLLVEYLSRRHTAINAHLAACEKTAAKDILDFWFQYSRDSSLLEYIDSFTIESAMTVDAVIQQVMDIEDRLISLYRDILDNDLSDHVREYFEMLLVLEEGEEQIMQRDALMMKEM